MSWLTRLLGMGGPGRDRAILARAAKPMLPRIVTLCERTGQGHYRHDAAGETFHQGAIERAWSALGPPNGRDIDCQAGLRLEADNPHDPNAVAVFIANEHVAYLGRDEALQFTLEARELAPRVDTFACRGRLTEWNGGGRYDVVVYFGFPLRLAEAADARD